MQQFLLLRKMECTKTRKCAKIVCVSDFNPYWQIMENSSRGVFLSRKIATNIFELDSNSKMFWAIFRLLTRLRKKSSEGVIFDS